MVGSLCEWIICKMWFLKEYFELTNKFICGLEVIVLSCKSSMIRVYTPGPDIINTFSILNSAEYKTYGGHKC